MQKYLFVIFMLVSVFQMNAQGLKRVEVKGKVVVDSDDVIGITVFNSSSNKGTTTDENGEFTIAVALNDRVEFGALQFKDFEIVIDEYVIASKKLTVFLVEEVNKLDEVVILPYDLTGNLTLDVESVRTFNPNMDPIYFGIDNVHEYEFSDDIRSQSDNIAMHSQSQTMQNGLNVINVVGFLLKPLFKSKGERASTRSNVPDIPTSTFKDHYTEEFLYQNFKIPKDRINEFIIYVEDHGLDYSLLDKGNELEFLEFISQKSKQFLNETPQKD